MSKPRYWDVRRAIKESVVEVSYNQLASAFHESDLKRLQFAGLDSRYRAVDMKTWELIIAYNDVDEEKYKSEHFDCDNFAVCFAGEVAQKWDINGVGIVIDFSAQHAYNCLILADKFGNIKIISFEPQADRFAEYKAENGFVMFT